MNALTDKGYYVLIAQDVLGTGDLSLETTSRERSFHYTYDIYRCVSFFNMLLFFCLF